MTTSLTLNNGVRIPSLGLGVFQSAPEETAAAVESALAAGYRHVDTAAGYGNEREVGEGIRRSGVDRDEVFVETKVWVSDYGYDETQRAFETSATKLGVSVIDLLILHQPMPQHFERTIQAYRGLERLLADGRVRSIGVSNFMPHHLARLAERTEVTPAVNQVELHPYFPQAEMRAEHERRGIVTESWSPLGKRQAPYGEQPVAAAAEAHGVEPGQVILRWQLQLGAVPIPKSATPSRQAQNIDLFGFELTDDEVAAISGLARPDGRLFGGDPEVHEEM